MRRHRRLVNGSGLAAVLLASLLAAACTSSSSSSRQSANESTTVPHDVVLAPGGLATWAEPPQTAPDYIFPINSCCFSTANLGDFQYLMYRPLYWFGDGDQPTLNQDLSLASAPRSASGGKTVVVNLKPGYMWSDGEHVDARDVVFFMDLLQVVKTVDWGGYVPGYFPDNVRSVTATGPYQVTFKLTSSYSSEWFTYNELSQITPLPMAWDVTRRGAAPGSGGCSKVVFSSITTTSSRTAAIVPTSAGARACFAVYNYLAAPRTGQAASPSTYAGNPLWQVVDGPWKLKSLDTANGDAMFVPNAAYSGPHKPKLAAFEELGFQTDSSEYAALTGGSTISVGYVPPLDAPQNTGNPLQAGPNAPALEGRYGLSPLYYFEINYFPLNFQNPQVGKIFRQQYVRAAMQSLIDQPGYVKRFDAGYGIGIYGPVPPVPATYASPGELANPYPYSVATARSLLESHGWTGAGPGATATCIRPGKAANECGAGVKKGARIDFTLLYANGQQAFVEQMGAMKAAWAQAGIVANLVGASFATVTTTGGFNCFASGNCSWQAVDWGGGFVFSPDYLPTGEVTFDGAPGCSSAVQVAVSNAGGYCDATNHANIAATLRSSSMSLLYRYEDYLAKQLPVLYQPLPAGELTETDTHLYGVLPQNVFGDLTPEYWEWQKGFVPTT
jgi:peptide/nickel transport system substrate-binding protein